jgi:redox-sensitive bicupin YhaK (pirin superfamily)
MLNLRKSGDRGIVDYGWLKAKHTFSFGPYYDPRFLGFRDLLVINEDQIQGGGGFPLHPHKNMEIVTLIKEGGLAHEDSKGNNGVILKGDVQRMSAGKGIRHSEFNHFKNKDTKLYQIWIQTQRNEIDPSYENKSFSSQIENENFSLLVSPQGENGSLKIHQNTKIWYGNLKKDQHYSFPLALGNAWVQEIEGQIKIEETVLNPGDGASISEENSLEIKAKVNSTFFIIELT